MAKINVLAGDFKTGKHSSYLPGKLSMAHDEFAWNSTGYRMETISASEVEILEVASEQTVKRFFASAGGAVAGGMALGTIGGLLGVAAATTLGPVGLAAGLLAAGNRKEVTFIAQLKDGRRMMATTDAKTFTKLQADTFQ